MKTEQKTTHTPGPWLMHAIYTKGNLTHWGISGPAEHDDQCTAGRIVDVHRSAPNHDGPTQEANARLIVTAPDLLEACRALIALAENDIIMVKNEGREPLMAALALANEAITKATTPGDTKE